MAPSSGSGRTPALKTYSKRVNQHPEEPPSKKRRVEEPTPITPLSQVKQPKGGTIQSYFKPLQPSSIPSKTRPPHLSSDPLEHIFSSTTSQISSDPLEPRSTPPSSPPARPEPAIEYPRRSQKRSKRRLTTRPVLDPIINMSTQGPFDNGNNDGAMFNDHSGAIASSANDPTDPAKIAGQSEHSDKTPSRAKADSNTAVFTKPNLLRTNSRSNTTSLISQKLHQTQLDMGVPSIVVCKECGMQYNTTLKEDQRNHNKFHDSFYYKTKQLATAQIGVNLMQKYVEDQDHDIRVVDHRVLDAHKERAYRALKLTCRDLEGVIPTVNELWSLITNPQNENDPNQVPRYKLFLYLIDLQPVGVLLAERIAGGDDYYHGARELVEEGEVYMCVDRIWVREDMRRKRIASQLVTMAREHFVPGLALSRMQFAFSHPTGMGRQFADAYIKL
ncbi:hypothetical protein N431DRAFT_380053 [Stipitochalara longipes BDJ]|nr:hypothetical protein N431DRAFT_380053 [Stipitochalara longipes BDJ]